MPVGDRLRELRESQQLSQEVLAEKAGVHRNTVGDIELGKASATVRVLGKLAGALGVEVQDLFWSEPAADEQPEPVEAAAS